MKVTPKRTFLLRQEDIGEGKKKDVIARKGEITEVNEKEAAAFYGYFDFTDSEKKKLIAAATRPGSSLRRIV